MVIRRAVFVLFFFLLVIGREFAGIGVKGGFFVACCEIRFRGDVESFFCFREWFGGFRYENYVFLKSLGFV